MTDIVTTTAGAVLLSVIGLLALYEWRAGKKNLSCVCICLWVFGIFAWALQLYEAVFAVLVFLLMFKAFDYTWEGKIIGT